MDDVLQWTQKNKNQEVEKSDEDSERDMEQAVTLTFLTEDGI